MTALYDARFYSLIEDGCRRSAAVVAPLVHCQLHPTSVIDVGCGEGWWAQAFKALGADRTVGIDGHDQHAHVDEYHQVDLARNQVPHLGRFDLAVCLEVAEHLPSQRARPFVGELCRLAPVILFSAALPGQGGVGHTNEQWIPYWIRAFKAHGYAVSGALRWSFWGDRNVENWYKSNMLVAAKKGHEPVAWFDTPLAEPWPVVHPTLWESRL